MLSSTGEKKTIILTKVHPSDELTLHHTFQAGLIPVARGLRFLIGRIEKNTGALAREDPSQQSFVRNRRDRSVRDPCCSSDGEQQVLSG